MRCWLIYVFLKVAKAASQIDMAGTGAAMDHLGQMRYFAGYAGRIPYIHITSGASRETTCMIAP